MAPEPTERIDYWRPADLEGIEVLSAERAQRPFRVFHETYTICTMLDLSGGETHWTYRGKLYRAGAGALALMEPGEVHANTRRNLPATFRVLFLPPSLVEGAARQLGMVAPPHLKIAHAADPGLVRTFARFHASVEGRATALERQSRLVACVRALLDRCTERGAAGRDPVGHPALLRARDYIQANVARPVSLDELAGVTGLSPFYLVRAFARTFGLPPHAYKIRVQVEQARSLLAAGHPPAAVAAALGFADQSHFTRHFKQVHGVTPARYASART